ncbi:hypothetical protein A4G20_10690 [Pasteurellaceae bacterium RH1A]|nr:hypothetical protein A4G20_10690 [Pasteurellaceae bacterium RH1A]
MIDLERYVEVYSNATDELLDSYPITLPDSEAIPYINPVNDDEYAIYVYVLNESQVISLVGEEIVKKYQGHDIEYQAACYASYESE